MKRVLFIGDSLTAGDIGINFINKIKNPNLECINEGRNGETIYEIMSRLREILVSEKFDTVVIEGGLNDLYTSFSNDLASDLTLFLDKEISEINQMTDADLIICTLSCAGENLNSPENLLRLEINDQINQFAGRQDIQICDVGSAFDTYLLSSEKGELMLTIDGVHLNGLGADIYAREISKFL